jgi:hypothetical protein
MKFTLFARCFAPLLCLAAGIARAEPAAAPSPPAYPGTDAPDVIFSIGPRGEVFEYGRFDMLDAPGSHAQRLADETATVPPEPDSYHIRLPAPESPVCATREWESLRAFEPVRALPALPPDDALQAGTVMALPPAEQISHQTEAYVPVAPPVPFEQYVREQSNSGVMGGAAVLILAAAPQNAEAYAINSGLDLAVSPVATQTVQNFAYGTQAAPLVWLGWQFEADKGIRTRFFWFNAISSPLSLAFDPDQPSVSDRSLSAPPGLANLPGQQQFLEPGSSVLFVGGYTSNLSVSSYLRLYALDLEYTYERTGNRFDSVFTAGGRYLGCDQSYTAFASASGTDPISGDSKYETQSMSSVQNFSGGGPTASWLGRMRLGGSRLAAYGCLRGSLLAGAQTNRINFVDNDYNLTTGGLEFTNGSIVTNTALGVLPIGEIDLGIEYGGAFWDRLWFVRTGVVAQDYFGLGSPNGSTGDLILIGAEVATGIRF